MKNKNLMIGMMVIAALVAVTSCKKSNDPADENIDGTYYGSFTTSTSLKSAMVEGAGTGEGTAEVTLMADHQVQVHCFGEELDTTMMLNYYEDHDSIMVCLTGADFEHMYGHMLGSGHMGGGMMGDIQSGETEWMHHLSDEHAPGDQHFGGFDMEKGTFTYSFQMMDGSAPYYLKFNGTKQ